MKASLEALNRYQLKRGKNDACQNSKACNACFKIIKQIHCLFHVSILV